MKESKSHIINQDVLSISLFLLMSVLSLVFGEVDFSLHDFSNLYISQTVLDGVDATKRVGLYYKLVLCSFIFLPVLYWIINNWKISTPFLDGLSIISTTGIFLIVASIMGVDNVKSSAFVQMLFGLMLVLWILNRLAIFDVFAKKNYLSFVFSFSFSLLFLEIFLFNSVDWVVDSIGLVYVLTVFFLSIFLGILDKVGIEFERMVKFFLPVIPIPILGFLSLEILFYFQKTSQIFIPYKMVFIGMIFVAYGVIFFIRRKKTNSISHLVKRYFVPSALLSFVLLTLYIPIQNQSKEMFELANNANAVMKIFQFAEIPFVEFFSSHMSSDFLFGTIYNLFFGYDGSLDFMIYQFGYIAIAYFIAFYFMYKLFDNALISFLFIISFPWFGILFYHSMVYPLITFFEILSVVKHQSYKGFLWVLLSVLMLILWRLEIGVATLFSAIVFLPLSFYLNGEQIEKKMLLKAVITVFLTIVVGIALSLIVISPDQLMSNFKSSLHYVRANQAHAYSKVARNFNHQFYQFYFIMPLVAVLFVLYIGFYLKKAKMMIVKQRFALNGSLFLYLIYLSNFQRGLVRHGFMEGMDSFIASIFYLATVLFIFSFLISKRVSYQYFSFYTISFLLIIFVKYYPIDMESTLFEKLLKGSSLKKIDTHFNATTYQGRMVENNQFANENYNELKDFLDANLNGQQTFLDFSNTPMLYFYCERNVPGYFCQNLQNSIDDYLQLEHLKRVNPKDVPIVVYSNFPTSWFDNNDGVPNAMRHYLIAEYIYQNYHPYKIINKHSIWISNEMNLEPSVEMDNLVLKPQKYDYKHAAKAINQHFELKENTHSLKLIGTSENGNDMFQLKEGISNQGYVFAKIFVENPQINKQILIDIMSDNRKIGSVSFYSSKNDTTYMISLSNHYLWHRFDASHLIIRKADGMKVTKIEFYIDLRIE